ncbi:4'-phosphopantetheinyl transferase family protein [Dongia soli]|uniref:4'-phosphopantetheinyl transferase superfamily protein n=1 Tax=Dongia soli TaxID=600628 RepID=A0ABU5EIX5_9PROT|nr:4'-phosphopantetheinyl transferase superfamily protein [Dongia soli]MDY0885231.1 4'-phosphopantetheinyl transferase superfamily protein [Dongia soli]
MSILREEGEAASDMLERWSHRLPPMGTIAERSRIGRALLYDLLQGVVGDVAADWRIETESSGRPIVFSPNLRSPEPDHLLPSVSIAHSGGWVMCGMSQEGKIGVDLEMLRSDRNWQGMAESAFGPQEVRRAAQHGMPGFYRLWTLREAMAKATGEGWPAVTDKQDRADTGPDTGIWFASLDGASWSLWHERMLCLATQRQFSLAVARSYRAKASPTSHMPLKWWHLSQELQMMETQS